MKVIALTPAQFAELQRLVMELSTGQAELKVGKTSLEVTPKKVTITLS